MQVVAEDGANRAGARILDGASLAEELREGLVPRVEAFAAGAGRPPTLGVLLAGDDSGSEIYVRNKIRRGEAIGMATDLRRLPASAPFREALRIVEEFNAADAVDGILVQSPLPAGMGSDAEARIFDAIAPAKDVDGFSPVSAGRLVQHRTGLVPCTPAGVMALLDHAGIEIAGRRAVVIGRSDIVGKPMALLLLHRHATVTICHSRTADLPRVAAEADILVAAVGRPAMVTPEFVKPGATVVDVGINPLTERQAVEAIFGPGSRKLAAFERRGRVLCGDVHPGAATVAGALTPVPGGVGPLTIAMLLSNTVRAAEARRPPAGG